MQDCGVAVYSSSFPVIPLFFHSIDFKGSKVYVYQCVYNENNKIAI